MSCQVDSQVGQLEGAQGQADSQTDIGKGTYAEI